MPLAGNYSLTITRVKLRQQWVARHQLSSLQVSAKTDRGINCRQFQWCSSSSNHWDLWRIRWQPVVITASCHPACIALATDWLTGGRSQIGWPSFFIQHWPQPMSPWNDFLVYALHKQTGTHPNPQNYDGLCSKKRYVSEARAQHYTDVVGGWVEAFNSNKAPMTCSLFAIVFAWTP